MNHEILPRGAVMQLKLYSIGLDLMQGMFVAEEHWHVYVRMSLFTLIPKTTS
jgi:hypothetical protein